MTERWEVEVTEAAYQDLRAAAAYVGETLLAPKAAGNLIAEFEKRAHSLGVFPEGRPLVSDFELARLGYRWAPVGNFMMFYRVDREKHAVTVDRFLYGARDWKGIVGS